MAIDTIVLRVIMIAHRGVWAASLSDIQGQVCVFDLLRLNTEVGHCLFLTGVIEKLYQDRQRDTSLPGVVPESLP